MKKKYYVEIVGSNGVWEAWSWHPTKEEALWEIKHMYKVAGLLLHIKIRIVEKEN